MNGLAAFEDALLALAGDALDACDRPRPDRALKYHGDVAVSCCDGNGLLTAHWTNAFPDRTGMRPDQRTPFGPRTADVFLRLYRCFPTLDSTGHFPDDEGDDASEGLAIDLDCIWSALTAAICAGDFADLVESCGAPEFTGGTPRPPRGGCAGLEFKTRVAWRRWQPDP